MPVGAAHVNHLPSPAARAILRFQILGADRKEVVMSIRNLLVAGNGCDGLFIPEKS
jgi:hypothetical protein